jgi:hypothetical protein
MKKICHNYVTTIFEKLLEWHHFSNPPWEPPRFSRGVASHSKKKTAGGVAFIPHYGYLT